MGAGGTERQRAGGTRDRLLAAARELFGERGYDGSSTREIADRAGVSEPMLFRHFGNKATLFEVATTEPCIEFMQNYVDEWRRRIRPQGSSLLEEARVFYTGLFDVLHRQRELLTALLAAHRFGRVQTDIADRLHATFRDAMAMFQSLLESEPDRFESEDQAAAVRLVVGMVLSLVLHDDWLMGDGLDRDRMLDEMSRLTLLGLLPRS